MADATEQQAKDLAAQYAIGDEPASPPGAEPVASTVAPASSTPPRDPETGKFLPREPAAPSKPARLVRMALDAGIDQSEIDAMSTAELREEVRDARMERLLSQRSDDRDRRQQPQGPPETPGFNPPREAPPEPEAIDIDEESFDPGLVKVIKRQAQEIKELRQRLDGVETYAREGAKQSMAARCDRAFSKHESVLGKGRGIDMKDSDPNFRRRQAVLREVDQDKGSGSLEQKIDRAVELLFGSSTPEPQPAPAAARHGPSPEEWAEGGLARPTHRNGSAEPKGRAKAERTVARILRENAANDEPTVLDEFPG